MSDAWVGLIGSVVVGLLTFCGVIYQSRKNNDALLAKLEKQSEISDMKLDSKLEKYQAVTDTKLEELTREVQKHNSFAERVPLLEAEDKRLNERIKALESKSA
jgi:hypothetical protein